MERASVVSGLFDKDKSVAFVLVALATSSPFFFFRKLLNKPVAVIVFVGADLLDGAVCAAVPTCRRNMPPNIDRVGVFAVASVLVSTDVDAVATLEAEDCG